MKLNEEQSRHLYNAIAETDVFPIPKGMTTSEAIATVTAAVKKVLPDLMQPNVKVVETQVDRMTSSIAIGSESKGGTVKIYFDPSDPEEMLDRIDMALIGRNYAGQIQALITSGGFAKNKALAEKFDEIVGEHAQRASTGEWRSGRKPL